MMLWMDYIGDLLIKIENFYKKPKIINDGYNI